ncbi:MAG: hypothetical protein KF817_13825 [Phycisphaeraceae bacterium]|nr:hypothetical protein [Phycisphaeraceae bacterium]
MRSAPVLEGHRAIARVRQRPGLPTRGPEDSAEYRDLKAMRLAATSGNGVLMQSQVIEFVRDA